MKKRVLLAEDDEYPGTVIKYRLEEEGFEVLLAKAPDELLAQSSKADVLVVDARLDVLSAKGLEAVANLVAENRLPWNVPIILYSIASGENAIFRKGLEILNQKQRPYVWLTRPFELAMLVEEINGGLRRHSVEPGS